MHVRGKQRLSLSEHVARGSERKKGNLYSETALKEKKGTKGRVLTHEAFAPDEALPMCANSAAQCYPRNPHACTECQGEQEALYRKSDQHRGQK